MKTALPVPAQGQEEHFIDLNSLVIKHPAATVFMQVDSNKYTMYGIFNEDLLVIDRSLHVNYNSFVVFEEDGEFHIGWVKNIKARVVVCGVITHVLHKVKEK